VFLRLEIIRAMSGLPKLLVALTPAQAKRLFALLHLKVDFYERPDPRGKFVLTQKRIAEMMELEYRIVGMFAHKVEHSQSKLNGLLEELAKHHLGHSSKQQSRQDDDDDDDRLSKSANAKRTQPNIASTGTTGAKKASSLSSSSSYQFSTLSGNPSNAAFAENTSSARRSHVSSFNQDDEFVDTNNNNNNLRSGNGSDEMNDAQYQEEARDLMARVVKKLRLKTGASENQATNALRQADGHVATAADLLENGLCS